MINFKITKKVFQEVLKKHLKTSVFSNATILSGIHFLIKDGIINITSTDGNCLLETTLDIKCETKNFAATYSGEQLSKISFVKPTEIEMLDITLTPETMIIQDEFNNFVYNIRSLCGNYPNYKKLIPKTDKYISFCINQDYLNRLPKNRYNAPILKISKNSNEDYSPIIFSPNKPFSEEIKNQKLLIMPIKVQGENY